MPYSFTRRSNAQVVDASHVNELQQAVEELGSRRLVIATSDATTAQKNAASVVLSGTSNQTAINTAIDALAQSVNGPAGGIVEVVGPNVTISGPILLRRGITLRGGGAVTTLITGTAATGALIAAADTSAKNDFILVEGFSLYTEATPILIDARWIGRSTFRNLHMYGSGLAGSLGIRAGGTISAPQLAANVVSWTNRVEKCRIANVERGLWFEGLDSNGVQTGNAWEMRGLEIIPTNTSSSTGIDIEDGDGNFIEGCDIGYAALAGGLRIGNNGGATFNNLILPNRWENVATSGSRRAIELLGTTYQNTHVFPQSYTDNILHPRVSQQTPSNHVNRVVPQVGNRLSDRTWGTPATPDMYWHSSARIVLGENYTIGNPAASYAAETLTLVFAQDATGGRTVTFGNAYVLDGWKVDPAPSAVSVVTFAYDGTNWRRVSSLPDLPRPLFYALNADRALANVNTAQSLFGVGANLEADTTYELEMVLRLSRSAGTTSHTIGLGFGGTATLANLQAVVHASAIAGTAAVATLTSLLSSAANAQITTAVATASENNLIRVQGLVRVTNAGTFIPQMTYSAAPGGAPTVNRSSFVRLTALGSGSVTSVGRWT